MFVDEETVKCEKFWTQVSHYTLQVHITSVTTYEVFQLNLHLLHSILYIL